ncbi:Hypothetical protein PP7435_CHR4-0634 [Komagataella phaffii CBS 7435]|uniref:Uncharacterized protein n=1 Tax=Komagataella phaffii (strain ATCC 76273 / CBS 7435 / CECT 11047 / NRRL Y-11430 / Wegner 21-1) TaxID=981350 RepID=F2QZG5_KOMPC|nr:Hypothetical protein PP7435_CHR4-0634 [Komagataella phaffii CBS 7435]
MFKKLLPLALFKAIVLADSTSFTINFGPGEGHSGTPLGVNDAGVIIPSTTGVRFYVNDDSQLKVDNHELQAASPLDLLSLINSGAETKGFSLVTDPPALLLNDATPSLWICESSDVSRIAISIDSPADGCIPYSIKPKLEANVRKGGLFARDDDLTDSDGVDTDTEDDLTDNDGVDTDTEDDLTDNDGIDTDTDDDLTDNDGIDTDTEGDLTDNDGVDTDTNDDWTDNDGVDTDTDDDWTDNDGIDTDTDSDDDQSLAGPVNPPTSATLANHFYVLNKRYFHNWTDNDGVDTDTDDDWTDNDGINTDTDTDSDDDQSLSGPTNPPTSTTLATTATSSTSTTSASALATGGDLTDSDTDSWTDNDGIDTDTDSDTDSDDDQSQSGPGNSPTGATLATTATTSATSTVSNGQVTSSDNGANHFAGAVGLSGAAGGVILALLI